MFVFMKNQATIAYIFDTYTPYMEQIYINNSNSYIKVDQRIFL